MGDIGVEAELVARVREGSLGPCSPSPASLLPIQLVKRLAMMWFFDAAEQLYGGAWPVRVCKTRFGVKILDAESSWIGYSVFQEGRQFDLSRDEVSCTSIPDIA